MLGSKNDFFTKSPGRIEEGREQMNWFLKMHDTKDSVIDIYNKAFDYFIEHPEDFDGATVVKDIKIIPNLDIWAMLHDYMYLIYNVSVKPKERFKSDIIYAKEMERCGLSYEISWGRFGLLLLTYPLFTPYSIIIGKKMSKEQVEEFNELYNLFI